MKLFASSSYSLSRLSPRRYTTTRRCTETDRRRESTAGKTVPRRREYRFDGQWRRPRGFSWTLFLTFTKPRATSVNTYAQPRPLRVIIGTLVINHPWDTPTLLLLPLYPDSIYSKTKNRSRNTFITPDSSTHILSIIALFFNQFLISFIFFLFL